MEDVPCVSTFVIINNNKLVECFNKKIIDNHQINYTFLKPTRLQIFGTVFEQTSEPAASITIHLPSEKDIKPFLFISLSNFFSSSNYIGTWQRNITLISGRVTKNNEKL